MNIHNNLKRNISFNETFHKYSDELGQIYTSVTTLIGKYHPKFDENYWAIKKAKELGTTPELIKQSWKQIREASCDKGNKEHKLLEDSINEANGKANFTFDDNTKFGFKSQFLFTIINKTNLSILSNSLLAKKYPVIYKFLEKEINDGWTLYVEEKIYWAEYLVAGMIDCLLIKGKTFKIVDWKTNKDELKFISGYYKKEGGVKTNQWIDKKEYFFNPINSLEYCKGNIHTMQLSLYAYILELWGFKCIGLILFHIRENIAPRLYTIIYKKALCQLLLINFKNASFTKSISLLTSKSGHKFGIS